MFLIGNYKCLQLMHPNGIWTKILKFHFKTHSLAKKSKDGHLLANNDCIDYYYMI